MLSAARALCGMVCRRIELMAASAAQVELFHTQFRQSEDHKLRAMLKRQSAKVCYVKRLRCGALFLFVFACVMRLFVGAVAW